MWMRNVRMNVMDNSIYVLKLVYEEVYDMTYIYVSMLKKWIDKIKKYLKTEYL